ncbi:MAG TPA: MBG domain-containing protein, partial [Caulobacteraceae bacterium]|nr:MBG domain-containing protein [Caulobacteraceae bacterium]
PKALTIEVNDFTKSYGQVLTFTGSEFTATGLVDGDTIAGVTIESDEAGDTAASVVGGPYIVSGKDAVGGGNYAASNYDVTYDAGELTVTPAVLVITPDDASKYYPTSIDFDGTEFTSAGLQNGESIGSVNISSDGEGTTAVPSSQPYMIIASAAGGGTFTPSNYAISYTTGELTVLPPTSVTDGGSNSVGPTPTFPTPTYPGVTGGGDSTEATAGDDSTEATAGEGTSTGSTPVSTPKGVELDVEGDGVRMPEYQMAQARTQGNAPVQVQPAQVTPAYTPQAPYVAPVLPRKQSRN